MHQVNPMLWTIDDLRSQGARVEFESEKLNLDTQIICAEGWGRNSERKPFKSQ
jgi:hypothetical protein